MLNDFHWLFLTNIPLGIGCLFTQSKLSPVKQRQSWKWVFHKECQTGRIEILLWRQSFWGSSKLVSTSPHPHPQWLLGSWLLQLPWLQNFSFKGYCEPGEKGIGQNTMPQSSLFFPKLNCFSWINVPWIVVKLSLLPNILKTFTFDNFCQCADCFYGGVEVLTYFSVIPDVLLPFIFNLVCYLIDLGEFSI